MKIFSKKSNFDKYYKDFIPLIKKEKNQKYLYIILSIGTSIFFLIFAINPTLTTISNLRKQIEDAKFVEEKLSEKINNLSNLSKQYQQLEGSGDLEYVLDAVPRYPEVPTLVGQIRSIGDSSSVILTDIEILPVIITSTNASKSSSFLFNVAGYSSFENSQKFLENLTIMQRVIDIKSIQITKNKKAETEVNFIYKGEVHFKK